MKFVQRWIARKLKWYWHNADDLLGENEANVAIYHTSKPPRARLAGTVSSDHGFSSQLRSNPVEMKIHFANGGYVVEFYRYDHVKDRSSIDTYVIDDNVDKLGESIAQVVVQYTIQNR